MNKDNHTDDEESSLREEAGFNLTPKQRGFVEYYIETGSAPEAAMLAYDCTSRASARVLAHRNLNNPKVVAFLAHFLLEHSLPNRAHEVLSEALHATKFVTNPDTGEKMEVADHNVRLKAVERIFKMVGLL